MSLRVTAVLIAIALLLFIVGTSHAFTIKADASTTVTLSQTANGYKVSPVCASGKKPLVTTTTSRTGEVTIVVTCPA
jgi:hypothetical protein